MEITYTIEQFVDEIREKYKSRLGTYPSVDESCSTIQHWIDDLKRTGLDVSEYRDILSGIDVTQFGNLALFHYADFSVIYCYYCNPDDYWNAHGGIYRTCRSTVIDLSNGETVIKPFDKFFNIGELPETSIETVEGLIESAKEIEISNKLDGSIFCVSRRLVKDKSLTGFGLDSIETNFCTSKSLNPETSWHLAMGIDLYRKDTAIQDLISDLPPKTTLMFEMITKEDAHVVCYPSEMYGLHLIGVRTSSGDLLKYSEVLSLADKYGVKTTELYDRKFYEVFSSLDEKKSDEAEGFVIRIDGNYFKLKYNDYVQVHKTINRLVSASGVIEAFKDGKIDDLISKVPATYKEKIIEIADQIANSADSVRRVQQIAVRKCFGKGLRDQMLWIQKNIPKILQGRCINAVKYKDFGLFSERSKGVLKLSGIKEIGTSANEWLKKQRPSEYEMVYGGFAKKISDCEGEYFNFGEHHASHSEEFSV